MMMSGSRKLQETAIDLFQTKKINSNFVLDCLCWLVCDKLRLNSCKFTNDKNQVMHNPWSSNISSLFECRKVRGESPSLAEGGWFKIGGWFHQSSPSQKLTAAASAFHHPWSRSPDTSASRVWQGFENGDLHLMKLKVFRNSYFSDHSNHGFAKKITENL